MLISVPRGFAAPIPFSVSSILFIVTQAGNVRWLDLDTLARSLNCNGAPLWGAVSTSHQLVRRNDMSGVGEKRKWLKLRNDAFDPSATSAIARPAQCLNRQRMILRSPRCCFITSVLL